MKCKPIIGIVSKPNIFCDDDLFTSQLIYDGVRNAVIRNNGIPIGILPTKDTINFCKEDDNISVNPSTKEELDDLYYIINKCDGIILEGGLSSDYYELEVAKYVIDNNIPILGICAGFNNIVRAMNGDVFYKDDTIHNREDGSLSHKNIIIKNTLLYKILNIEEVNVNSIHTMFAKKENINNLEISSYSIDGYVETVELKNNDFCLGVKWHPELMENKENMDKIFKYFIKVCSKNKK